MRERVAVLLLCLLVVLPAHADEGVARALPAAVRARIRAGRVAVRHSAAPAGGPLTVDVDGERLRTTHCRRDLRALRALAVRRVLVGRTFRVDVRLGDLEHAGRTLYSSDPGICVGTDPDCNVDLYDGASVLSLVGPILSIEQFSMDRGGGGDSGVERMRTVDVRDGSPVELTRYVDEASLLDALRHEPELTELREQLAAARTYAEARTTLSARLAQPHAYRDFALVDYDANDDLVSVQLAYEATLHNVVLGHLDVRAHPTAELRAWLLAAQRGDGHLLRDGPIETGPAPD